MTEPPVLRYGVVTEHRGLRRWQRQSMEKLERSGASLQCFLSVLPNPGAPREPTGRMPFSAFCDGLDMPSQDLIAAQDLKLSGDVVRLEISSADASAEALTRIRTLNLDFLLLFGSKQTGLLLRDAAKLGVWYFVHSDITRFASPSPCFWEIYHDHDVTAAFLMKLDDERSAGVVLKSGFFATISDSYRMNVESSHASLPDWPSQVCRELRAGVAAYFSAPPVPDAPAQFGFPNALQILAFRWIQARNTIARFALVRLFLIDWNIGRLRQPLNAFIGRDARAEVSDLRPYVRDKFIADPCVVAKRDRVYVFCEEYSYKTDRGIVAAGEFPFNSKSQPHPAIEEPFHLSYPQVFEHGGAIYCIPESSSARCASLYEAVDFPLRWKRARALLDDFAAVDSTLLKFEGRWWLFCTNAQDGYKSFNSHLYVWYSSDLFGTWIPHPRNPVKIDARSARPAGRFIEHEGRIYRPAQNCSRTYGGSISINRVDTLTTSEYKETVIGAILPPAGRYDKGLHTISTANGWTIVDVKAHVFDPRAILTVIKMAIKSTALVMGVSEKQWRSLRGRAR